jgi:sporulation protein YlmC with PRC-barrel domain
MSVATKQAIGAFTIVVKKSILGAKVINSEREDLGTIEDIILDARENRVAYAILSFGGILGLGDKHFAIPWEALSFDVSEKTAVLAIDKERLSNAPGFDKDNWPDMANPEWGTQVHEHYGLKPYSLKKSSRRKVTQDQAR